MKLFFCWSGDRSKALAEVLASWFEQVIQAIEPWISTGLEKGKIWQQEIGQHLEEAKAGIICLTPENLESTWIHFESGALSKTKDARLFTFYLGLQTTDVKDPLSWYQATTTDEKDIRKLATDLNTLVGDSGGRKLPEKTLDRIFNANWPQLSKDLKDISAKREEKVPARKETDLLQEAVRGVRDIQNLLMQQQEEQRKEKERKTEISTITPVLTSPLGVQPYTFALPIVRSNKFRRGFPKRALESKKPNESH